MSYLVDTDVLSHTSPSSAHALPGLRDWLERNSERLHLSGGLADEDQLRHRVASTSSSARAGGTEVDTEDALIAATADLNVMTVLTANTRHFALMRVRCADPRARLPPDAA